MKRLLACLLILSCHEAGPAPSKPAAADPYEQQILKWRVTRRASLMKEDGWLSLVGLEWLNPDENDVKLPTQPPTTAHFRLADGNVTLVKNGKVTNLRDDTDPQGPTVIKIGTFRYNVIKRNDKLAIRMKDSEAETRAHFQGLDYFPVNPRWRIEARFEPFNPPRKVAIANVLGMTSDETAPGELVFDVDGKTVRIMPILEQGEKDLFIIFKDATSGKETYPAARYLYAAPPGPDGKTIVDFNKSYNPPCAFTHFATCPLPPPQNRLPFRIEAGEKKYAGGHG
jgi:uncharacterized protein (DUF1684 family)